MPGRTGRPRLSAGGGSDTNTGTLDGGGAGEITITGGDVTATGGPYGAGIGSGYTSKRGGVITIGGVAAVKATGNGYGAGIGGGAFSLGGEVITISGAAVVNAVSGGYAAGIGGGAFSLGGGDITIRGSAEVNAESVHGAGIGAGYHHAFSYSKNTGITISGGMVRAYTVGDQGHAAGIGGVGNNLAWVNISGGTVRAFSVEGAGIGAGNKAGGAIVISGGTIITAQNTGTEHTTPLISGVPFIFGTGIAGRSSNPGRGIALDGDVSIFYTQEGHAGVITLEKDFTIPDGAVLTIPKGWTMDLNGKTLTNQGAFINHGMLLTNDGTFVDQGAAMTSGGMVVD